ncbi:DNA polymerase IV [Candidatus Peregrinibacteria bacterium]|nr:DNA polymerase IV [Candidatus Peregrinibacteria bacterium]MBT3599140.1 DNA polymerase IV [Candidatus Peregrinibacteria bacterium]MBT4367445.1 DNA polymerase IV [Candidatus Peregrinibacteria bacterium]MBT4585960.1 DNA polymerase IV [Candidatus Peregrinibacteria bacterium]MBT6730780.1 DNA polymerase IV [Candidatus Peregrinibacteria bacterium]
MFAHIDADAFFTSVLQRKNPSLKGKAVLATGMGGGCVIAASYPAKAYGVKTGMRVTEAKKLVPKAIVLPSDFLEACVASEQLQSIIQENASLTERYSVDEWFLDLNTKTGGCPKNLKVWAQKLQSQMLYSTDISVSFGIAPSKLLAKMASDYRKPAGITVLFQTDIEAFLKDRSAEAIPGIGRRRALHAQAHRWNTAWDVANANLEVVQRLFGKPGLSMQQELLGKSIEPICAIPAPPKSISRCRSFRPTGNQEDLCSQLFSHLTRTVLKMRLQNLACQRVTVWLRDKDYKNHIGHDCKLPQSIDTEEELLPYVKSCFSKCFNKGNTYTQVGLGLMDMKPKSFPQYSLFQNPKQLEGCEKIQKALDKVHQKYGRDAVLRGSAIYTHTRRPSQNQPTMYGEILSCR